MKILKEISDSLRPWPPSLLFIAILLITLSAICAGLSVVLLQRPAAHSETKVLVNLKKTATTIRQEFVSLLDGLDKKRAYFKAIEFPERENEVFQLFEQAGLDQSIEGLAWLSQDLTPMVWYGNTSNLKNILTDWPEKSEEFSKSSFIIKDRASSYLVYLQPLNQDRFLAFFELMAFQPQFQSQYLKEFQHLRSVVRAGADINFWEFAHNTEALDRLFSRSQDEYLSQQREERESRTLYFPLRNEENKILATVTLNSLQIQQEKLDAARIIRILVYLLAVAGLVFLVIWLNIKSNQTVASRFSTWLSLVISLGLIRYLMLWFFHSPPVNSPGIFSPQVLAFISPGGLTSSPADIFLTFVLLSLLAYFSLKLFMPVTDWFKPCSESESPGFKAFNTIGVSVLSSVLIFVSAWSIKKIVLNSNLNLLNFSFSLPGLLIYLSLFLSAVAFILPAVFLLRLVLSPRSRNMLTWLFFLLPAIIFYLILWLFKRTSNVEIVVQILLWSFLAVSAAFAINKSRFFLIIFVLVCLFQFALLRNFSETKNRQLTDNILVHLVNSQKTWAEMAIKQAFTELNTRSSEIVNYFRSPADADFARSLWNKTLLARFNWNSCLYLQSSDRKLLSSFSLNVPVFPEQTDDLNYSEQPEYQEQYLDILGQEKHFLIGYRDFRSPNEYGGRLVVWVSVDPELLPFFYSANPYFELLRLNTLPSLQHFPVYLAVFDGSGQQLFNQQHPGFALEPELRYRLALKPEGIWSKFQVNGQRNRGYFLTLSDGNIYVFYQPIESFRKLATKFLKLVFLLAIFLGITTIPLAIRKKEWRLLSRSFSGRVYLAFLAVALIPLFFFIFFTQTMVENIFSNRFVQEATSRAYFARAIIQDFISLQEQNEASTAELPEDLVFWISNTLNNDVNLFRNGIFLSSSRREFFETGILSELIDGETYFKIVHKNQPIVITRRTFGKYSYQTLTVPYRYHQDIYFLSLPFPFEKQEVSQAASELFEFFIFASVFFILLIAAFSRAIKRMIVLPINKLIRATQQVSLGNLDVQVEHRGQDELKSLVDGFNTMVENLKAHEKELAELSQKVAWTEMARKVAHEIKNPLTPIQLSAEHTLKVYQDKHPEFDRVLKESISYIISEVENLKRIAQEFMTIARESGAVKEIFDLKQVLRELIEPYRNVLSERIIFSLKEEGSDFRINADRGKIKVAVRNFLINAIEAIKGRGKIELILREKNEEVEVEIKDTGCGIPKEILSHIFEPYFSTKEKGTGLGLAICKKIIEEHEGSIGLESQSGRGTRVVITLPRIEKS